MKGGHLWAVFEASWLSKAWMFPHTYHIAVACSHECGSWWMGACGYTLSSLMMLASTPVCPAMASYTHPQPLPTSPCSVRLTPAPFKACSPPLGQTKLLHNLPLSP